MRIYVGNINYNTTEEDLEQEFSAYGEVKAANIITDKITGRSRGFAFVEMEDDAQAQAAITGLNSKVVKDRTIVVNEARPRAERNDFRSGRDSGYGGRERRY